MVHHDTLRRTVADEVGKGFVLTVRDMELPGHGVEHGDGLQTVVAAELHETQQQQGLFVPADLSVQGGADAIHRLFTVQVIRHLVRHAHVAVQVEIKVNVADSEMMT